MSGATTWSTDRAAAALARAEVPRWVVRSMLLGAAFYTLAAFGMWLVSYRHRPDVLLTFFGPTLAIALGMAYVGWSLMRPSRLLARPGLLVSAIVPLGWIIGAAFEFGMRAGAGPKMIAIAAFQAIVVTTMALEAIVGAWAILRLDRRHKHLLDEARPFSALVGAPAALSTLTQGRPLARSLFVLAALLFVLAALQLPGLLVIADFNWNRLNDLCANSTSGLERTCVDRFLNAELIGQFLVWPATFLGCLFAGGAVEARARRRTLDTAANAMARNDSDPPILFLRSFRNDQVALAQSYRSPLRWLLGRMRRQHFLDHMLVEEFAAYGPTVALGRPGEPTPPFGVWRSYLHDASDEAWQDEVSRIASGARAIVMVADDTDGVAWELAFLGRSGLAPKTLFLASPQHVAPADNRALWVQVAATTGVQPITDPACRSAPIIAMSCDTTGRYDVATSARFEATDYRAALRHFFRTRFETAGMAGTDAAC